MPIVKSSSSVPIVGITTPYQQEQRISNNILKSKVELKDTALSRMVGIKSEVTYYRQKTGGNNYLVNTGNIHTLDPNISAYEKVEKFIIICQGELNASTSTEDAGKNIAEDGTLKTLPQTLQPQPNDYFIMFVAGKKNLYRITEVNKSTVEDDTAYECQYQLVDTNNAENKLTELEKNVIENYIFEYSHVGTKFRTIYRADEFKYLAMMADMYITIGSTFNELFYDKNINTYILPYTTVDLTSKDSPYTSSNNTPVRVEDNSRWTGSAMYDRELMKFVVKNELFQYINKKIIHVTEFLKDNNMYSGSIFYALEKRNYKYVTYTHYIPLPINYTTPGTLPHLYGKVDLIPTIEVLKGAIYLFPLGLIQTIRTPPSIKLAKDVVFNDDVEDYVNEMMYVISCYINKVNISYNEHFSKINEILVDFITENKRNEYVFYLFPMIAYIIKNQMEAMSSRQYDIYS